MARAEKQRVSPEAAAVEVEDLDGKRVRLDALWKAKPVVLVFLRHFGWLFCREQAVQVHREKKAIGRAGATLAFVGNGGGPFARSFAEELGLETPVYVDVSLRAYEALGMKRGVLAALASPSVMANTARALRAGFRQKGVQGDPWQLGGVFVIVPGGAIRFAYASSAAGDHPPVEAILAALPGTGRTA